MSRIHSPLLVLSILGVLVVAACSGSENDPTASGNELTPSAVASALFTAADEDEAAAITGTLIAADRGYSLQQIANAALASTFDVEAGAVTIDDGYALPDGAAGGFFTDAPALTSAGALAPSRFVSEGSVDEVVNLVGTFLSTPPAVLLQGVSSDVPGEAPPAIDPVLRQEATAADHLHLLITLVMIDRGFSVEQITDAIVFGERLECTSLLITDCNLGKAAPALRPTNILDRSAQRPDDPAPEPAAEETAWSGEVDYIDDSVEFEPGTSEVTVVRDADGEFFMTANLTYRTLSTDCFFDWEKTFSGTGELDPSGTRILFEGSSTTKNTSSCPDPNLQDSSVETVVIADFDGSTVSGVVLNGMFSATPSS